jgi:site-specific recombinase XerD
MPGGHNEIVVALPAAVTAGFVPERGAALVPADQNAAAVYLARLDARTSRPTQACALRHISRMLLGKRAEIFLVDTHLEAWMFVPWGQLRYQHVRAIHSELHEAGAAPATLRRYVVALRQTAEEAKRLKQMSADDLWDIQHDRLQYGTRLPPGRMITDDELDLLYATCDANVVGWRNGALLGLLATGGLRRGEAAEAITGNYSARDATLMVTGKRNQQRLVVLPESASKAIQHWLSKRPDASPWIFPRMFVDRTLDSTKPMSGQGVLHVLRAMAGRAGISATFGAHDFRRTYVSSMLSAGVDLALVSRLVGHKNTSTTARYDRRDLAAQRDVVEKHQRVRLPEGWWT